MQVIHQSKKRLLRSRVAFSRSSLARTRQSPPQASHYSALRRKTDRYRPWGKAPRNRNVKKKDHPLTTCSLRHHLFRPSVSSGGIQPRKSNRRNKSFQGFLHGANLDRAPWGEVNQSAAARLAISKPNIWHMAFLRRTYGPRGAQHKTRFG